MSECIFCARPMTQVYRVQLDHLGDYSLVGKTYRHSACQAALIIMIKTWLTVTDWSSTQHSPTSKNNIKQTTRLNSCRLTNISWHYKAVVCWKYCKKYSIITGHCTSTWADIHSEEYSTSAIYWRYIHVDSDHQLLPVTHDIDNVYRSTKQDKSKTNMSFNKFTIYIKSSLYS